MKVKDGKEALMAGTVESIQSTPRSIVLMVNGEKAVFAGKAKSRFPKDKITEGDHVILKGYEGYDGDFMAVRIMTHGILRTAEHAAIRDKIRTVNGNKVTTYVKLPMEMEFFGRRDSIKEGDEATLMCFMKHYKKCEQKNTCMRFSPSECKCCDTAEKILYRIEAVKVI